LFSSYPPWHSLILADNNSAIFILIPCEEIIVSEDVDYDLPNSLQS
jgi:hypothetical protein